MKLIFFSFCSVLLLLSGNVISQVNPQNGAAQVNIPLYSYSDPGNRLGLSAALVYVDGNGLKVSEMASSVGTGWELDCGGSISRIQHGAPDDQYQPNTYDYNYYNSNYFGYMAYYYPNGYLYSEYSPSDVIDNIGGFSTYKENLPSTPTQEYKMPPYYTADREQDIFAFSFNGRTGQFVIGKNKQVKILNDSKLKVDITEADMSASSVRTRISQFKITDESGIQYVFKDLELDYVCSYNDVRTIFDNGNVSTTLSLYTPASYGNCVNCGDSKINVILGRPGTQLVVNKWYLSQIINPFSNKQITFNYTMFEEDIDCDKILDYSPNSDGHGSVTVLWQKYKAKALRLSSVTLSNAEKIDFLYSVFPRIDLTNQRTLDRLQVSYNGSPVYSWAFGYGYLEGREGAIKATTDIFTDEEKQWARLCLLSLKRTGLNNKSEPPYQFGYNMGGDNSASVDVIPPMFSIYQDHYGYYNAGRSLYSVPEGTATAFYSSSNLKVLVQNNGSICVGSCPDNFKDPLSTVAKNGILKSITYPLGGVTSFAYEANATSQKQLGGVRVATTTQYDGVNHTNDIIKQYKYINADGTSSGWNGETFTYSSSFPVTAVVCGSSKTPAFQAQEMAFNYVKNGFFMQNFSVTAVTGLGGSFSGDLISTAVIFAVEIAVQLLSSGEADITVHDYKNVSTVADNPLPWGYARTEVVNLLSSDNVGKTVYEFSSPQDHAIEIPNLIVPYSSQPRYGYWAYGLPKTITAYDKLNHVTKKTVNNYSYIVTSTPDNNFASMCWYAISMAYACHIPTARAIPSTSTDMIIQEIHYPLTGRSVLNSTDEYTYNAQQQSTLVTTNYEYDANFQLKHKYFNNSKGEKVETFYYRPYDYSTAPGAIGTMNSSTSNIFNTVLSTETYINKSDGNKYLIGAVNNNFDIFSNGDIKPKVTYAFQNPAPLSGSSLQPWSPGSVLRDPAYFKQIALYDYDNCGNLVQTVTGGNKVVSNIYDYDGKLLVASASNASYSDIGYTSFETTGGKPGSWLNTGAIVSSDARTGSNCFNLSDPSNAANNYFGFGGLNSGLTYIVSYWSKNGTGTPCIGGTNSGFITVSTCQGSAGWKQGATVNGWTYYEVKVSNADKINAAGTGLIDEFRIYPVGSQMTTTTYSPLIGKTSECDVSNRVTYYWYDDLGRLIKISDDQRNTIRTYEYNYKQ